MHVHAFSKYISTGMLNRIQEQVPVYVPDCQPLCRIKTFLSCNCYFASLLRLRRNPHRTWHRSMWLKLSTEIIYAFLKQAISTYIVLEKFSVAYGRNYHTRANYNRRNKNELFIWVIGHILNVESLIFNCQFHWLKITSSPRKSWRIQDST